MRRLGGLFDGLGLLLNALNLGENVGNDSGHMVAVDPSTNVTKSCHPRGLRL